MAGACSPLRFAVDGLSQIDIDRDPDDLSAPSLALRLVRVHRARSCDLVGRDHADVRSALGEQGRERIAEVEASAIARASGRVSDR